MALRFIDGFTHYTTRDQFLYKYAEVGSSSYVSIDVGRRSGSKCVRLYSTSGYITKTLDEQATWVVGATIKIEALPSGNAALFRFRDNTGNAQATLCITTTGALMLARGSTSGTVLATSGSALPVGAWNYVEAKLTIADSGGYFEVRVNGQSWASYTGDTKYSSSLATANSIKIFGLTPAVVAYYGDLYICDGTGSVNKDFLGDVRVDTIFPSGAGAAAQFTPTGSANNWENVDDASPDEDAGYNVSDTAGATDSFVFADVTALNASVFGFQANILARKDDAGTRTLRGIARVGGANYEGSDRSLSDSYVDQQQIWDLNPATSAAWTEAAINAAEFGYKVQA